MLLLSNFLLPSQNRRGKLCRNIAVVMTQAKLDLNSLQGDLN